MKTFLKTAGRKALARVTWANLKWVVAVNVLGWVIQGAIFGALSVAGVDSLPALVSAKVANWIIFLGQCVQKARS